MQGGITLKGASLRLQGREILAPMSFALTEARIGFIGRNGSGKTSLLRLMAGLVAPSTGEVLVEGTPPTDRRALLGQLGILFQNPDHQILFPTVGEELAFGLRQQGHSAAEAEARVAALLKAEGRSHWLAANTHTLSQGQRHYLCLLAILLMQPATILLDEPFAGLDLPTEARLARRLAALPQRLITISHAPLTMVDCDRVLWLEKGRIRADGPPSQVLPAFTAEMARIGERDADTDLAD
ncbi:MAG: energy-coupling factor ABC transporter ATP-binding protein [Cypionkella sp.]